MTEPSRIILVGAVESTAVALERLCRHDLKPELLITIPDDRRGMHSDFVDVAGLASHHSIDVLRTLNVSRPEILECVRHIRPDYIFVIGWSRLCGSEFRGCARLGVLGYHPTLLPKLRGRSALAWTILLDLRETGGTLFWIDEGTDTGAIAAQNRFPLSGRVALGELMDMQMTALGDMLDELLPKLKAGECPQQPQQHASATYVTPRRPEDGLIDWTEEAAAVDRLVRAVSRPYPGAFTYWNGLKVIIWKAEPVSYPHWFAQVGQVFLYEDGCPVVRCGGVTDLKILECDVINEEGKLSDKTLTGQLRFGSLGR